jgi:RNA 3'-terminal phosphate cyclase (ATP)
MSTLVEIDGTMGEGGGQVLRSTLTLSLLTGRPVRLHNIRARRDRPGLGFQHRMAVLAAARISRAEVEGDRVGSLELLFSPGPVVPGEYRFDIGTAGSTSLVLQTVLLPLALSTGPSRVTITGGTHVPLSPCFHYLDWHWRVMLARIGVDADLRMAMAGFYPEGGGEVHAALPGGARIGALTLTERGRLLEIRGLSAVANLPEEIAERQMRRALRGLQGLDCPTSIAVESLPARSRGTVVVLLARFEQGQGCFYTLGAPRKRAEWVADEAVEQLLAFLGGTGAVDRWMADQLLLPLALADGPSEFSTSEISLHLLTHADVIRRFLPVTIEVQGALGEPGSIRVTP